MPLPITDEEKIRITHQVFALFALHGFDGISMDEVARQVNLSKATLYKYFKSKEDIVRDMVGEIRGHLCALHLSTDDGIDSVLASISAIYFKSVLIAAYSSSKFLADLEEKYPDAYADYISALDAVQIRFADFYAQAVREGYCRALSISLVGEQTRKMLPVIIRSDYRDRHGTTLPDVIAEYYKLLLYQLLSAPYLAVTEQEGLYSFVEELVQVLREQLLIR
ncbi:MAG: TetR/AcrR family transcriptional regulator [Oscillospiraceae bacterium]|nr:TetR/AcrR family transcriptional regulator [Oscillospiraceae bacterium]